MKAIGNTLLSVLLAALLLASPAQAALDAQLDRQQVALGDTLRLIISATGDEDLGRIDLTPLERDFEILQRSSNSNVSIINGQRSQTRQLILDLTAKREGTLQVPPLSSGGASTAVLTVSVSQPPELPDNGQAVVFEAEVDRDSVYVQGQILLTLRVQQAINLDARSVSELQLDNAFVKPLEQKSFQRTVNGKPWLVHEVRYAIFPEQSGTLEIPGQTFSARESQARRSLFDRNQGRAIRRNSDPVRIEVLPRPDQYPANATWLPARQLKIVEQWSTPPEQLQAGQSATRSIRLSAEGLQGAQLPPVLFPATPGLKYYPDQPEIVETEVSTGIVGQRTDSAALVPIGPGTYHIPEIRIPWWDTESGELREAVLPGRDITVTAAPGNTNAAPAGSPAPGTAIRLDMSPTAQAADADELWLWRAVAGVAVIGWLATLLWLWRSQRRTGAKTGAAEGPDATGEAAAYKQLQAACASNQAGRARAALLNWGQSLYPDEPGLALEHITARLGDAALADEVHSLNQHLYAGVESPAGDQGNWDGKALAANVKALRKTRLKRHSAAVDKLSLYPG